MARRVVLIVLGVLVVALVVLVGAAGFFAFSPLPKTNGTITASGLQAPVTIYRDEWGVPQIYADSIHDLYFTQGYVHAQDRLFQLDFQRRVGLGRLSEVLGDATLDTDRFLRTVGTNRAAQQDLDHVSPDTLAALQAYSDGVNAYIGQHEGDLPLEFRILGYQPEPWQPLHSVAWGKAMAYNLASNWENELMRAQLIDLLGADAASDLLPAYPEAGPYVIPPEVKSYSGLRGLDYTDATALRRLLKSDGGDIGSNNWVVAGSRSTTGMPLLANDPHLGLQMPSVFYEIGLHGGGVDVVGLGLPGTPGVLIGHNGQVAWGMTTVYSDQQDLFIEKSNPDNPNQVEFKGQWEDMQVVEETIQVKGGEPVVETVRISRHGPIMNAVVGDLAGKAEPVALRWTALDEDHLLELGAAGRPGRQRGRVPQRVEHVGLRVAELRHRRHRRQHRHANHRAHADPRRGRRPGAGAGLDWRLRVDRNHPLRGNALRRQPSHRLSGLGQQQRRARQLPLPHRRRLRRALPHPAHHRTDRKQGQTQRG